MLSRIISQPKKLVPALARVNWQSFSKENKGSGPRPKEESNSSKDEVYDLINADPVHFSRPLITNLEFKEY
jgi:hypothetical protein